MRPHLPILELILFAVLAGSVLLAARTAFQPTTEPGALVIRAISPADGTRVPARNLRITAEVIGERDLKRVNLRLNDREVEPVIEQRDARHWRVSYLLPTPTDDQDVLLVARDQHGRQRTQSWSFQVDPLLSAPVFVSLHPPADGYAPAGDVRIAALVQVDAAIATATLTVGGESYPTTIEPAGTGRYNVIGQAKLTPGDYEAGLTVIDHEGDRSDHAWNFQVPDPQEKLAFEQTGRAISGGFRAFWQKNGGLSIFGLPISNEMREDQLIVQYFERARFEYHPKQDGVLSEVKLGLIVTELRAPDRPRPPREAEPGHYFQETGHAIDGPFRAFWEQHGGLPLFGLPITDKVREGDITIQHFERARFELHQIGGTPTILLGHIGREAYEKRYGRESPRSSP